MDKQDNCHGFKHIWSYGDMEISFQDFCAADGNCSMFCWFHEKEAIMLMFCLASEITIAITGNGQTRECRIPSDACGVHYNPGGSYRLECPSGKRVQILRVFFPRRLFLDLLGEGKTAMDLRQILEGHDALNKIMFITPLMCLIINQISNPSSRGASWSFFMTAKVLELVDCILNSWNKTTGALPPVTPFDRDCVRRAQAILEDNLENPPSISELASRVGVSAAKLKQVFPRACGMPPYSYLRKLRMEKAFRLLGDGSATITEVAYDVGYSSISHFSKIFADHFGMRPSEFRGLLRGRRPPNR